MIANNEKVKLERKVTKTNKSKDEKTGGGELDREEDKQAESWETDIGRELERNWEEQAVSRGRDLDRKDTRRNKTKVEKTVGGELDRRRYKQAESQEITRETKGEEHTGDNREEER